MKRNLFYLLMLVCSISVFTACSDDDDVKYPIDEEIAGTYKGALDVFLGETNIAPNTPKNISITNAGDNRINMGLKNLEILGMNLTINIPNCEVKESADGYSFTGSQTLTLQAPIGDCPTTVNGTVSGGKTTINLDITVPAQDNLKVKVTYKGAKLTGSESSEAKILSFTFDSSNDANAIVVSQPVEKDGAFSFAVTSDATASQISALVPSVTISDKATLIAGIDGVIDFNNAVTYTVIAEDGTMKKYVASIQQTVMKFSFESWTTLEGSAAEVPLPRTLLASSSEGTTLLSLFGVEGFPLYKTDEKKEGNYAARLVTMDISDNPLVGDLIPAIVAGSLFTGKFDLDRLQDENDKIDRLNCTMFGVPYEEKPLRFTGWYKYAPGDKFIDASNTEDIKVLDKKDECSIAAILYKVTSYDETLTGHDINKSEKIVATAIWPDGTAKSEYTKFDVPFTYIQGKTYEKGTKYKLAVVCSSSKEGDFFKGAGGSTLILDEIEVTGEKVN